MTEYRSKIYALLNHMKDLRTSVRGRGPAVEKYLEEVVPLVKAMTRPFREDPEHRFLLDRFRAYAAQEERRLREGLETAKYDLDALDTLALINGPRGLERVRPSGLTQAEVERGATNIRYTEFVRDPVSSFVPTLRRHVRRKESHSSPRGAL